MDKQHPDSAYSSSVPTITTPWRTLLVLCGPAGCGKSTFAQRLVEQHTHHALRATTVVSSDCCRALVCDDEANQQVNRDAFDLFHFIIQKRLLQERFTIADSTALQSQARLKLLELARRNHYSSLLLIFNISAPTCLQRDLERRRSVGEKVIARHTQLLQQTLLAAPNEGWNQVYTLDEQNENVQLNII
ncbi:MAG: AAA family ATPase [Ktedonobacteraceae bacterium]|nr:AAA family ATPase [Ktedonobacteraceae bacterium]